METRKPKTSLTLLNDGTVRCYCGTLRWFAEDINDFIIPILGDRIIAEFNDKRITVVKYDNVDSIINKFKSVW